MRLFQANDGPFASIVLCKTPRALRNSLWELRQAALCRPQCKPTATDWKMANTKTEHRGGSGNFAEDRERAAEAGRTGGQHSSGNFAEDRERAAEAGRKGGQQSSGNFAHDRERASEAGQKGGHSSHGGRGKE
jgi:hypothetical protein